MHSKIIEAHKANLKLDKLQREIIIGLMLGDGHLETQNQGRSYRLKIEYSERQKEYIDWLWSMFQSWSSKPPQLKIKRLKTGTIIKSFYFTTYSHGAFRFYAQQFYLMGLGKVIPKMIKKLLTPLNVAIWFMDDGSWKSDLHKTYIIHVDGYRKIDLTRIQNAFREKFGIETALHKQYDNWRLYIKTQSANKFKSLIEPYVIPSMQYKLGNNKPKE